MPDDDTRWMTYGEVRDALGLPSARAALARSRRGNWPRRLHNDGKLVRVGVPVVLLAAPRDASRDASRNPSVPQPEAGSGVTAGVTVGIKTDGHDGALAGRLDAAEARATRAEGEAAAWAAEVIEQRERAARAEGEAAALQDAMTHERAERAAAQVERDAVADELHEQRHGLALAEGEAEALRGSLAHERTQSVMERGRAERAERARDAAEGEAAAWMAGGPFRRAVRAFLWRRG